MGETDLREHKEDRWITSTCPQPWPLTARLLNCSAIHCTENVLLVWKRVCMWTPPLQPILFLSHPLPPPSNWLSISFSKSFELNVLSSQNLATSTEESDQWERKEQSDPLEAPILSQVCFPACGSGKRLGLESEEKESMGWFFSCLGHWRFDHSLPLPLKDLNIFYLTPWSCKLPVTLPSVFCEPGLNQTVLQPW